MKIYAIKRKDGTEEIMFTAFNPADMVAKWHPNRQNEITGEIREITAADIPAIKAARVK
jgi:hypothetical protein